MADSGVSSELKFIGFLQLILCPVSVQHLKFAHGLVWACISGSAAFNGDVPFNFVVGNINLISNR